MVVKVCDALCGQGKTMSCIRLMNEDIENKYLFITPYLDEVERIKSGCSSRNFISPEKKPNSGYSKLQDLHSLLRAGENIASTHALFSIYTEETKELIRDGGYIIIIDEVVDLYQPLEMDGEDVNLLLRNNIVKRQDGNEGSVVWEDKDYSGGMFSEIVQMSKARNLIEYDGSFFFWTIPIDLFTCFKDAYVLTYMFEYQFLKYYFDIHGIEYRLIGTKRDGRGFTFCPIEEMDRRVELRGKIHINQSEKLNEIGNDEFSLSSAWYERMSNEPGKPEIVEMKNNLYKVFRGHDARDKMWSCVKRFQPALKGKGYSNGFITYNKRATNEFANRHQLAYCLNVYPITWMKSFLDKNDGVQVDRDMYALSVLIQWMFRSAVRKGEEVWLYIPSRRMRTLLTQWLDNLAEGKDLTPISYKEERKRKRNIANKAAIAASKIIRNKKEKEKAK